MILACHTLIYSDDADATRAFLRDVLGFPGVEAGTGDYNWLIFRTGPSELGCTRPSGRGVHLTAAPRDQLHRRRPGLHDGRAARQGREVHAPARTTTATASSRWSRCRGPTTCSSTSRGTRRLRPLRPLDLEDVGRPRALPRRRQAQGHRGPARVVRRRPAGGALARPTSVVIRSGFAARERLLADHPDTFGVPPRFESHMMVVVGLRPRGPGRRRPRAISEA